MIAICIIGGLLLIILLLLLLRAGCQIDYSEEGFFLWVTIGAVHIQLIPEKEKKHRPRKPKKSKQRKKDVEPSSESEESKMHPAEKPEKKPGKLTVLLDYAKPLLSALGQSKHKPRIDYISLQYMIAGKHDPAQAAIRYGAVSAGGGALIPLINEAVVVKQWNLQPAVDFDAEDTKVALSAKASCRIGGLICFSIRFAKQMLPIYQKNKKQEKPEEEKRHGRKASDQ